MFLYMNSFRTAFRLISSSKIGRNRFNSQPTLFSTQYKSITQYPATPNSQPADDNQHQSAAPFVLNFSDPIDSQYSRNQASIVCQKRRIHPTAEIAATASISDSVEVSAWSVVGSNSTLGSNVRVGRLVEIAHECRLQPNVQLHTGVLVGPRSVIGQSSVLFPHAVLGYPPQDRKYRNGPTRAVLGDHCVVREGAKIERGTELGGGTTKIHNHVLIMANAYIGHDCVLHRDVVVSGNASLAGHVELGAGAVIGGHSALHQRVRVGEGAMVGAMTAVRRDVVPFTVVSGNPASLRALNYRRLWPHLTHFHRRVARAVFQYLFASELSLFHGITRSNEVPLINGDLGGLYPVSLTLRERANQIQTSNALQILLNYKAHDNIESTQYLMNVLNSMTEFILQHDSSRGLYTLARSATSP